MDNETTGVVTEETARPVKKVVLKRKPVVKKTPKIKEEETEVKAPVEEPAKVEAVAVAQAPAQVEQPKAEAEPAPKKRRNKAKQKAEQEKKAPAEEQVAVTEASAQTSEEEHAESQPESKGDDQSDRRFDRKQNQNQNQRNNQKNNNKKFNNNGKQDQRQNQQKKPMSMEDIAISDEEYQSDLSNRLMVNDLSVAPFDELKERLAEMAGTSVDDYAEYKKQEVVMELIKTFSRNGGVIYAVGTLEILSDGYGFLRSPLNSYLSGPEDVYVSAGIIKFLNLKTGDTIEGMMRTPKDNERFFAIAKICKHSGRKRK